MLIVVHVCVFFNEIFSFLVLLVFFFPSFGNIHNLIFCTSETCCSSNSHGCSHVFW